MKKPWSITTTLRNPERIRNFLVTLNEMSGEGWTRENQKRYQILLIQYKYYGLTNQFLNGLSQEHIDLLQGASELNYSEAEAIFNSKNYEDPSMRGRQSFNPLKKMGLARIQDGKIEITTLGEYLLQEDYDLGEMFFRAFLKWQVPNPDSDDFREADGFNIKPFIGTLHLISTVNRKMEEMGREAKGISKTEFSIFVPTLIDFRCIEEQAERIINLRMECEGKSRAEQLEIIENTRKEFAQEFLETEDEDLIKQCVKNLKDYGDNTHRYFRMTRYFYIRGGGNYIDLEPRRKIEMNKLLSADTGEPRTFANVDEYRDYIADINQPVLPWETEDSLQEIVSRILEDVHTITDDLRSKGMYFPEFTEADCSTLTVPELRDYANDLRAHRRELQDLERFHELQTVENIKKCIAALENIHSFKGQKSVELERLITLSLGALNDALAIKPNYPVGDDNEPTFTAPANKPDIECFYQDFNAVCEVTMLTDRTQWYNEGQPVMRHLRDFEDNHANKEAYCVFVAPRMHQDTIETFWMSVKHGYRGTSQRIIPLSISQFILLLKVLVEIKESGSRLRHAELRNLYDKIIELSDNADNSDVWIRGIPHVFEEWKKEVLV